MSVPPITEAVHAKARAFAARWMPMSGSAEEVTRFVRELGELLQTVAESAADYAVDRTVTEARKQIQSVRDALQE